MGAAPLTTAFDRADEALAADHRLNPLTLKAYRASWARFRRHLEATSFSSR